MEVTMVEISAETAAFLTRVLDGITLSVGAPDFEETATAVLTARRELRKSDG
jgi:hypothetical protein